MRFENKAIKELDLSTKYGIEQLSIDVLEMLARNVVQSTCNDILFGVNPSEEAPDHWIEFLENVKENNDLLKMVRYDIRQKSINGASYLGFDLYDSNLIIWFADSTYNNKLERINGFIPFYGKVNRTFGNGNGPILKQKLIYTAETVSILFEGGVGVNNENDLARFPVEFVTLKTPDYINDAFRLGINGNITIEHNLGVLPVFEFLNKDVSDLFLKSNIILSDWYPAQHMIPMINSMLKYFATEMRLDHTRIMAFLSQNELSKLSNKTPDLLSQYSIRGNHNKTNLDSAIEKDLIVNVMPISDGVPLQKMQSTLKSLEHTQTLNELITTFFKMCGYSWGVENNSVYENVSQTQNSVKGVYENTKEKISIYTRQWNELFQSMAFSYFKNVLKKPMSMREVKREFEKYIEFKIISNVVLEQNNDWRKIQELYNNKLISTERAISLIFPHLKRNEIKKELIEIEKNETKNNIKETSEIKNRHFFGQENEKNNNDKDLK